MRRARRNSTRPRVAAWLATPIGDRPRPPAADAVARDEIETFMADFCDEVAASATSAEPPNALWVDRHLVTGICHALDCFISGEAPSLDVAFGVARSTSGRRPIAEIDESRDSRLVVAFINARLGGKSVRIAAESAGKTVKPIVSAASVKKAWGNPLARETAVAVLLLRRRRSGRRFTEAELCAVQMTFSRLPDPKGWNRRTQGSFWAKWIAKHVEETHAFMQRRNNQGR